MTTVADFTVADGEHIPFVLTWYPSHEEPPRPVDARYAIDDTEIVVARWAAPCTFEGEWRDAGGALAHHAEGAHLRPDRRHRGRRHDVAARDARRRAQLGLPLLLAARRHLDPRGPHARRLPRRGPGLARLAAAGRGRRRRRSCRSCTAPPASAAWTSGRSTGWRATRAPTPVRIGNAASGQFQLDVYGEVLSALYEACAVGSPLSDVGVGPADGARRLRRAGLGPARRGHLGGARPAAALHPLQGHGLGGGRPGGAHASRSSAWTGPSTSGGAARPDPRRGVRQGLQRRRWAPSPSTTGPTTSTPACS